MRRPRRRHNGMISAVMGIAALAFAVAAQRTPQNELVQLEQSRERCENVPAALTALNLGEGSQVADIGVMERVVFVMKGGEVVKNDLGRPR
ncbi:MAG: hypothetical protein LAO04_18175 [Acidobacteriia bacterium]|nr:hypothetical protein [Terriglobia bacterium]